MFKYDMFSHVIFNLHRVTFPEYSPLHWQWTEGKMKCRTWLMMREVHTHIMRQIHAPHVGTTSHKTVHLQYIISVATPYFYHLIPIFCSSSLRCQMALLCSLTMEIFRSLVRCAQRRYHMEMSTWCLGLKACTVPSRPLLSSRWPMTSTSKWEKVCICV